MLTYKDFSKIVRAAAGHSNTSYPIEVLSGSFAPRIAGKGWYYTNKSGEEIIYPNAYRRKYGKPIYHNSTLRIEVGVNWLFRQGFDKMALDRIQNGH